MDKKFYNHNYTVPEMLINTVSQYPDHGIGFIHNENIDFLSYEDLLQKAKSYLFGLRNLELKRGETIILALNKNEETVPVLWACFLGGIVPTILQPPVSFAEINPAYDKIINVYQKMGNPLVVLSDDIAAKWESTIIPDKNIIPASYIKTSDEEPDIEKPDDNDIAFVQFSSGSTGEPKGVVLTHKNIRTNLRAIAIALEAHTGDNSVNWMPLYHDMGLFGYHILPISYHYNQYLIETTDFIVRPFIWLDVIDKVQGTILGCPNFGQEMILKHLKRKKPSDWDLSSVKVICNGAEPISYRIMNDFIEKLEPYKLRREAMMPVYGMAEATLAISFPPLLSVQTIVPFKRYDLQFDNKAIRAMKDDSSAQYIVGVGQPLTDIEIRIVDDYDNIITDSSVGHIHIKGPGVTSGYYNDPDENNKSFCGDWLRTGDQGFIYDSNLFINGRYKDVIFMHGRNFYANDLESIALQVENVTSGKIIFGGVFDEEAGSDKLILFLAGSLSKRVVETFLEVQKLFRNTLGLSPNILIPIHSNKIPKTSSGKIQRYKLISKYLKGEFDQIISDANKMIKELTDS